MNNIFRSSLTFSLLLAAGSPVLLNSCSDPQAQQAAQAAQEEVESLKKTNAKLDGEVKQLRSRAEKGDGELLKRNVELQKEADEAKAQFEKLQDEATKARKELEDYMVKYKISQRARLKGFQVPVMKTRDDQAYQAVVFREITATEVSFAHSGGVGRLGMEKLPSDLQEKFLYDPAEVKRQEESKVAAATATHGLEGVEEVIGKIVQRDPNRPVNPVVVHNLKTRILTRQQAIDNLIREATKVKGAGDDRTNLGKYRLQVLQERATRLKGEIAALAGLLDKELNG